MVRDRSGHFCIPYNAEHFELCELHRDLSAFLLYYIVIEYLQYIIKNRKYKIFLSFNQDNFFIFILNLTDAGSFLEVLPVLYHLLWK